MPSRKKFEYKRHFTPDVYKQINALIARVGTGDATALEPLTETIRPFVENNAKRIAQDVYGDHPDDAKVEDAVQATYTKMISEPAFITQDGSSWIQLSQNIQLYLRQVFEKDLELQERDAKLKTVLSADDGIDVEADPLRQLFAGKRTQAVGKLLTKIPERHANVMLAHTSGDSYAEIADELGTSGTRVGHIVKKSEGRLSHYARQSLMQDHISFDGDPAKRTPPPTQDGHLSSVKFEATTKQRTDAIRDRIRQSFKEVAGLQDASQAQENAALERNFFVKRAGLSTSQYHALMVADLSQNEYACLLLQENPDEIARTLSRALKDGTGNDSGSPTPFVDEVEMKRLVRNLAGVAKDMHPLDQHQTSIR